MNTEQSEYDAIIKTVQIYIDGARSGKGEDMKPAFHKDAMMFGYEGTEFLSSTIQDFFDWHDENGAANDIQAQITSIDLANTVASVRVEIDNWTGDRYTDFFTMLKMDGQWKIMNKVFHLY